MKRQVEVRHSYTDYYRRITREQAATIIRHWRKNNSCLLVVDHNYKIMGFQSIYSFDYAFIKYMD